MNSYYLFLPTADLAEIGDYPQVQDIIRSYFRDDPASFEMIPFGIIPAFEPLIGTFVLSRKAKLTDVLSVVFIRNGEVVNNRVKNIFEKVQLPIHKVYQVNVQKGKKKEEYFWYIFDLKSNEQYIDFNRTKFRKKVGIEVVERDINFYSFDELINYEIESKKINIRTKIEFEKLYFTEKCPDIVVTSVDNQIYISNVLLDLLYEDKITGFDVHKR